MRISTNFGGFGAATRANAGALLGAFLLAGCTAAQKAVLDQGVEHIRQAKDTEAEVLKASLRLAGSGSPGCFMSVRSTWLKRQDAF